MSNGPGLKHDQQTSALSRRNFMLEAAGVTSGTLALGTGVLTPARAEVTSTAMADCTELSPPASPLGSDRAIDEQAGEVSRSDVVRFGRIAGLMTAQQLRLASEGLPGVDRLPAELAKSLTAEEARTAALMLAWMKRWKARHAEPKIRATMMGPGELAPHAFYGPQPLGAMPPAPMPSMVPAESGNKDTGTKGSEAKLHQLCQTIGDRLGHLQTQAEQAVAEAGSAINHARDAYQAALKDSQLGNHQQAWSRIGEAMEEVNRVPGRTELAISACNESEAIVRALGGTVACRNEVQGRLNRLFDSCRKAVGIGTGDSRGTDLWQLHFALVRLGQQLDQGQNSSDPSVSCVDLSQTGDFWNWYWKQVRGGWGGDTNPPGWFPVDWFNLVQATVGRIVYINMEPDGDIHINLSAGFISEPGWTPISALVNGNNPSGQLICEIPLCDRGWFQNLAQVCVGKDMWVVGKWMVDVWNQWYELHPIYSLGVFNPVIVP